ncbi:Nuclear transport factor 2 (NTF2) family protein with RNA binding (RRM-RBD-RNP motif) domain [Abeliophyllum distichum]|uniref:Nuclear transport factor 2 (NTF2) family protein with RNA binding (RRM-RBD-RNP motif) domain n=1 Tax=Abeliophyllum distichum TaxID=126358 RepID=A0ABD1VTS3_9LAMI
MATAALQPVSAQVVGNAFVEQYYHILYHTPELVHRFYQDISKLGRPEEDGSMSITTTMQAINEKILSFNYGDLRAEIRSVDAQESFNGGVQVLVTGRLTGMDNTVCNFTQTFFLAPQDKGYFVLNDMFRFLDNVNANPILVNDVVAPITPEKSNRVFNDVVAPITPVQSSMLLVQENHVSEENSPSAEEANGGEVYNPPDSGELLTVEEEVPVAEVVDEVQGHLQMVVQSNVKIEDVPKKSYASLVRHYLEKVLHYLATLRPCQWLEQMVCTVFRSEADTLNQTSFGDLKQMTTKIGQLYLKMSSALKYVQSYSGSVDGDIIEDVGWGWLCVIFGHVEKLLTLAASLHFNLASLHFNFLQARSLTEEIFSDYRDYCQQNMGSGSMQGDSKKEHDIWARVINLVIRMLCLLRQLLTSRGVKF